MRAPANPFQMDAPSGRFFSQARTAAPKIRDTAHGTVRNRKMIKNCSFVEAVILCDIFLHFIKYRI